MKNLMIAIAVSGLITFSACGQTANDLPEKVKTAFSKKFPEAQKVKWGKENANEWEAEFKMAGKEYSANFNAEGTWMETEYEISANEIPAAVIQTLGKEFPSYKLLESEISETAKGKIYEFEIRSSTSKMEVAVQPDGTLATKEAVKEKKKEKD